MVRGSQRVRHDRVTFTFTSLLTKSQAGVLTPRTLECELIWRWVFTKVIKWKLSHRIGPNPRWLVSLQKGKSGQRDRHTQGEDTVHRKGKIRAVHSEGGEGQRLLVNHRAREEGQRASSPSQPSKEPTLSTPRLHSASPRNYEKINFCCLRKATCGALLEQPSRHTGQMLTYFHIFIFHMLIYYN